MNTGTAGWSHGMECDEFLARHSDYLDGQLSPAAAARLTAHADACASCARYDRIVRKGMDLVHALPDVVPSDDFDIRLQHRLLHVRDADAFGPPRAGGAAVALGIAAAVALLAWSPLLVLRAERTASSAVDAAPAAEYVAADRPLFEASPWSRVTMPIAHSQPSATLLATFPGPYSPLIVTPPEHRSVRAVSTGYTPGN